MTTNGNANTSLPVLPAFTGCSTKMEKAVEAITRETIAPLFPARPVDAHKGDFGRVVNVAGCDTYIGASLLSTRAVLSGGAGLCGLASTPRVIQCAALYAPEAVFVSVESDPTVLSDALARATAIAVGSGLRDDERGRAIMGFLLETTSGRDVPLVLDAGALTLIAFSPTLAGRLAGRKDGLPPVIMTPHPGEAARLLGYFPGKRWEERLAAASEIARRFYAVVVLKGHETIVFDPAGTAAYNTTGNPGLARGGSGDVLTGIIAAFVGRGLGLADSARAGVFMHGLAGDIAAKRLTCEAMLPSDVIEALPGAFGALGIGEIGDRVY
jgi:NAD(P)H-hydrate epimerase